MRIGVLHPGAMGAALASCLDGEVYWAREGRSAATRARAADAGISDRGSLESLVADADVVISVCPPAAALDLADSVSELGFDGLYVDANAISPASVREVSRRFARFIDGGIVGPPPAGDPTQGDRVAASTRLYLSGSEAHDVAGLFAGSSVDARVIGVEPGRASALKMAYAAWTKGSSALLLSVAALAASEDVGDELYEEWDTSIPGLRKRLERTAASVGEKAWRFVGEMEEIARTFEDAGLPGGFHLAAADLYLRLEVLKGVDANRHLEEILALVMGNDDS